MKSKELLTFIRGGVKRLLERGAFANGDEFRPTQHEALLAYRAYLARDDLTDKEKLVGFFTIPTGVGKTAVFLGILNEAHELARSAGRTITSIIVVPRLSLFNQTRRAMRKYAPTLLDQVGFYGGRRKELNQPLTIMTYDAWVALTESGDISSGNVDILISDEGHRSISENRLARIFAAFDGITARLSFTATDRFDEERSVERSHHRKIFGKKIKPAAQAGELAAYIQSQFYAIRVDPPRTETDDENQDSKRSLALRKEAWTKRMVALLRDGTDAHTGDPLSDAVSGFYVADVDHARNTERQLNADPALARKARQLGFDGVAVAIYGVDMPPKEVNRRLDAFLAGRYMAVVGDEMLKEGLDHPALKNVFDWQRKSPVDKEQIIGRALRKYWDPVKQRWAGANIIDTIVYVGSNDPETDRKRKANALRYSVKAWEILEDVVIFGPNAPAPATRADTGPAVPAVIDGQRVDGAITLEQVNLIKAEAEALGTREAFTITDELRERLLAERERIGVPLDRVFEQMRAVPDGLSVDMVRLWMTGQIKSARQEHWDAFFDASGAMPDAPVLEITDALIKQLRAERDRTGLSTEELFKRIESPPEGLTARRMMEWQTKARKTTRKHHWDVVMEAARQLPDMPTIRLTKSHFDALARERDRTGLSAGQIVPLIPDVSEVNRDYTTNQIRTWLHRSVKSAPKERWDSAMAAYKAQPDAPHVKKIDITEARFKALTAEKERTGLGAIRVFGLMTPIDGVEKPDLINTWLLRTVKTARRDHWDHVMATYQAQPSVGKIVMIELTAARVNTLRRERDRTGVGAVELLAGLNPKADAGLTNGMIDSWAAEKAKSARKDFWDLVIAAYAQRPSLGKVITVTPGMRTQLLAEVGRTGAGAKQIFNGFDTPPPGMSVSSIERIMDGRSGTARAPHWHALIEGYARLPTVMAITPDLREQLNAERARTGVSPRELINRSKAVANLPSAGAIDRWYVDTKSAVADQWNAVMTAYKALPGQVAASTATDPHRPAKSSKPASRHADPKR